MALSRVDIVLIETAQIKSSIINVSIKCSLLSLDVKNVNMHTIITKKIAVDLFVTVILNIMMLNHMIFVVMEKLGIING